MSSTFWRLFALSQLCTNPPISPFSAISALGGASGVQNQKGPPGGRQTPVFRLLSIWWFGRANITPYIWRPTKPEFRPSSGTLFWPFFKNRKNAIFSKNPKFGAFFKKWSNLPLFDTPCFCRFLLDFGQNWPLFCNLSDPGVFRLSASFPCIEQCSKLARSIVCHSIAVNVNVSGIFMLTYLTKNYHIYPFLPASLCIWSDRWWILFARYYREVVVALAFPVHYW